MFFLKSLSAQLGIGKIPSNSWKPPRLSHLHPSIHPTAFTVTRHHGRHSSKQIPHRSTDSTGRMGKRNKKNTIPDESHLSKLPTHPNAATTPIIDTHTHLLTTFSSYKRKYPTGKYDTVWDFVRGVYDGRNVKAIVDVWCEAPVQRAWKELADSALSEQDRATTWDGIEYWFVMGTFRIPISVCCPSRDLG